jgi:hypothetical protein
MSRLFGVIQSNHGHEYRWLFTDDAIYELTGEYPENDECIDFFPMSGSNVSAGWVQELVSDDQIINFLKDDGYMDSNDPMLVDCGEYAITINDDDETWGSVTRKYLDMYGLTADELEQTDDAFGSVSTVEAIADYFKEIGYDDFDYENPFYGDDCEMRVSELIDLYHEVDPQNTLGL